MVTVEAVKSWLANTAAITSTLHGPRAHWVAVASSTLVRWVGGQGVPIVASFALVAVGTGRVVKALQTPACQAVAVPGGIGVHIVAALTGLTRPHWTMFPKGVPKVAVGTELTAGASDAVGAVIAHHLLCLWHHGAAESIATGTGFAAAGVVRVVVETDGAVRTLDVGVLIPRVTISCVWITGPSPLAVTRNTGAKRSQSG